MGYLVRWQRKYCDIEFNWHLNAFLFGFDHLRYTERGGDLQVYCNAIVLKYNKLMALLESVVLEGCFALKVIVQGPEHKAFLHMICIQCLWCLVLPFFFVQKFANTKKKWHESDNALNELISQSYAGVYFKLSIPCDTCIRENGNNDSVGLFSERMLQAYLWEIQSNMNSFDVL